jgi:hypothetical protein
MTLTFDTEAEALAVINRENWRKDARLDAARVERVTVLTKDDEDEDDSCERAR